MTTKTWNESAFSCATRVEDMGTKMPYSEPRGGLPGRYCASEAMLRH